MADLSEALVQEAWKTTMVRRRDFVCTRFGCGAKTTEPGDLSESCPRLRAAGPHQWREADTVVSGDFRHGFRAGFEAAMHRVSRETDGGR